MYQVYIIMCQLAFFPEYFCFSPPVGGLFSRSRLRGMQGVRVYITALVWVPTGLRGACSGSSKSRILADNPGEPFRPTRAKQDDGNPPE